MEETGYAFPVAKGTQSTRTLNLVQNDETIFWYWQALNANGTSRCYVRFRKQTESFWFQGVSAILDTRTWESTNNKQPPEWVGRYRSIISYLAPDTTYIVEVLDRDSREWATATVKTWPANMPESTANKITFTANRTTSLELTTGGTYDAYRVIDLNGFNWTVSSAYALRLTETARYVKVINSKPGTGGIISGASGSLIEWNTNEDTITTANQGRPVTVIENVLFENWGGPSSIKPQFGENYVSCIRGHNKRLEAQSRLFVRNVVMRNPRYRSNFWTEYGDQPSTTDPTGYNKHPSGPQGVTIQHVSSQGRLVFSNIRAYCDNQRVFNDIIAGSANASMRGFPGLYGDIRRCKLTDCADDPIEADGPGFSLIRDNHVERTFTGISMSPVIVGPMFYVGNVVYDSRNQDPNAIGVDTSIAHDKNAAVKTRTDMQWDRYGYYPDQANNPPSTSWNGGGQQVVIHNTFPRLSTHTNKANPAHKGVRVCLSVTGRTDRSGHMNVRAYNNILSAFDVAIMRGNYQAINEYSGNVYTGTIEVPSGQAANNLSGNPSYVSGTWRIASGAGRASVTNVVPNMGPAYTGTRPDAGAWQQGATPVYGPSWWTGP